MGVGVRRWGTGAGMGAWGLKVGTGRVATRGHLALDGEAQRDLVAPRGAPLPARVHQDEVRVVRLERGAVGRVVCSTGGVLDRA